MSKQKIDIFCFINGYFLHKNGAVFSDFFNIQIIF